MSHAVIQTGGKQYLVAEGQTILVEKVVTDDTKSVNFPDLLSGKTVTATVVADTRGPKVDVRKFKSKVRYLRRHGHRQQLTQIRIEKVA